MDPAHKAGRPTGIDEIHLRHGQNGHRLEHWGRLPVIPRGPTNVGPAPCSRWHPQQWAQNLVGTHVAWLADGADGLTSLLPSTIPLIAASSLGIELSRPAASAGPLSRADSPLGQNPPGLNIFFLADFDASPFIRTVCQVCLASLIGRSYRSACKCNTMPPTNNSGNPPTNHSPVEEFTSDVRLPRWLAALGELLFLVSESPILLSHAGSRNAGDGT